jgi:hypothetical protein
MRACLNSFFSIRERFAYFRRLRLLFKRAGVLHVFEGSEWDWPLLCGVILDLQPGDDELLAVAFRRACNCVEVDDHLWEWIAGVMPDEPTI